MKIFNLTDVETEQLKQRNLVNHTFGVGTALISPGQSVDVPDVHAALYKTQLQELIANGAASVEQLPESYKAARDKQRRNSKAPDSGNQSAATKSINPPAVTSSAVDKQHDPSTKATNLEEPTREQKSSTPARADIIDNKAKR